MEKLSQILIIVSDFVAHIKEEEVEPIRGFVPVALGVPKLLNVSYDMYNF